MTEKINIAGSVHAILDTQEFASGFKKRVLVIKTPEPYPQLMPVEFVKDKCSLLDTLTIGQQVTAHVNLRGNEFGGKYYANIQGWKLDTGAAVSSLPVVDDTPDDIPF